MNKVVRGLVACHVSASDLLAQIFLLILNLDIYTGQRTLYNVNCETLLALSIFFSRIKLYSDLINKSNM